MTELNEPLESVARGARFRMRDAARGDNECVRRKRALRRLRLRYTIAHDGETLYRGFRQNDDARVGEILFHDARHVGRFLRLRESALACFDNQRKTALGKKVECVLNAELGKRGIEELFRGTVVLRKCVPIKFGIGNVATAAACDVELLADRRILFKQQY